VEPLAYARGTFGFRGTLVENHWSRKYASMPCIFGTPSTHQGGRFGMKCLLWRCLAISVTMPSGPFLTFLYTVAQSRKLPSFSFVSNSGQIWRPAIAQS